MFHKTTDFFGLALVGIIVAVFLSGCGEKDRDGPPPAGQVDHAHEDHADPHDVPLTEVEIAQLKEETAGYAAAIGRIESLRDTIRRETTGGTPAEAHRALDQLDLVLGWLPGIARDSDIPKASWEEINTTAKQLQESFNKVHANIDAGKKPDYEAVAAEIDEGIQTLAGFSSASEEQR